MVNGDNLFPTVESQILLCSSLQPQLATAQWHIVRQTCPPFTQHWFTQLVPSSVRQY